MKKRTLIFAATMALLFVFPAWAKDNDQEEPASDKEGSGEFPNFRVGAGAYGGMAWAIGDFDDDPWPASRPRFAGGGAILGDMYLMDILAITAGLGLQGQGFIIKEEEFGTTDGDIKYKILYMDVPLGAKLDFSGFQVGIAMAIQVAFTSKYKSDTEKGDTGWEGYRRFNLAPRATLGYAIPLGPLFLVPTVDFSMQLMNNAVDHPDYNYLRNFNVMAGICAYYGI